MNDHIDIEEIPATPGLVRYRFRYRDHAQRFGEWVLYSGLLLIGWSVFSWDALALLAIQLTESTLAILAFYARRSRVPRAARDRPSPEALWVFGVVHIIFGAVGFGAISTQYQALSVSASIAAGLPWAIAYAVLTYVVDQRRLSRVQDMGAAAVLRLRNQAHRRLIPTHLMVLAGFWMIAEGRPSASELEVGIVAGLILSHLVAFFWRPTS